ncbi:hypothetical protein MSI_25270 [Treponema sp. JC4]|uniref:hypothetical protein n=1 Tax=Treponema sp. JC4 TaxID=1124982 RepID=UPI00025B05C6|nr:hypothetical protein [Treponema sp. JC4]EID84035.1 hypothetical protein MSI_25270 [Treponema sp. JC4]
MNYVSEEMFLDIDDYLLEKYEKSKLEGHILFQKISQDVLESQNLKEIIETPTETFQDKLFMLIKSKNLDEVEIYKHGNISRQLFSKIRSEKDYHPTKNTVFALAIGMHLTIDETSDLLDIAGYSFSKASKKDLIIQYFIYHNIYNIPAINEALDKYGCELL